MFLDDGTRKDALSPAAEKFTSSREAMALSTYSSDSSPYDSSLSTTSESSDASVSGGHARYPSSSSSLASSPPLYEHSDFLNSTRALPKLAEEPPEYQEDFVMFDDAAAVGTSRQGEHDGKPQPHPFLSHPAIMMPEAPSFDLSDDFFSDDVVMISRPLRKRRKSHESSLNSFKTRFSNNFPTLPRRWRERSVNSTLAGRDVSNLASPRPESSRTSSLTSSGVPGCELSDVFSSSSAKNSSLNDAEPPSPVDIVHTELEIEDPVDREKNAPTPLLPPMLTTWGNEAPPVQSPLQSPTVADPNYTFSATTSPLGTPSLAGVPSPPLSTKPSISSFSRSKLEKIISASDIPPLTIADPNDEWSMKLGHANFVIYPEPYIPAVCDTQSCRQLFNDWEQARCNFMKHQIRTGEHFGVTSETYQLTGQKWAEIDAQWKRNNDFVVGVASARNHTDLPITPTEPSPVCPLPILSDPKNEGKFPKLGDEDIVGPMVQIAARVQPKESRKPNFLKIVGDFSGTFFGRSSTGIRSGR